MKTIFKDGNYQRVDNSTADLRVNNQGWNFVPKTKWKENVRDAGKVEKIEKKSK